MLKVKVDNVQISQDGSEVIHFSLPGEGGSEGNFRIIERNPQNFGYYKIGATYGLNIVSLGGWVGEVGEQKPAENLPEEEIKLEEQVQEEIKKSPAFLDRMRNLFSFNK